MRPELAGIAATQGGVVTRRQAKACGYGERELKTLTGTRGAWVVVRRGVYAERELWEAQDHRGRHLMRIHAAHAAGVVPAAFSHSSAAALLGLPVHMRATELLHVTRPGVTGCRTEGGIKHHGARFRPGDVVMVNGVPVLGMARTAVDMAREYGFEDGAVAADAALRLGVSRAEMQAVLEEMTCWPQVTTARAVVEFADGGAANGGETCARILISSLGMGRPETQVHVRSEGREAYVDFRLRRHFFEFDGKIKFLTREEGGVATRPASEILWEEKQREDWLRRYDGGHGMSRLITADLYGPAREATARRLRQEVEQSDRLFGHLGDPR